MREGWLDFWETSVLLYQILETREQSGRSQSPNLLSRTGIYYNRHTLKNLNFVKIIHESQLFFEILGTARHSRICLWNIWQTSSDRNFCHKVTIYNETNLICQTHIIWNGKSFAIIKQICKSLNDAVAQLYGLSCTILHYFAFCAIFPFSTILPLHCAITHRIMLKTILLEEDKIRKMTFN